MRYKLVASDFDNTIFNGERVSPRVVKAIADYRKAGGKFVVATGRVYPSIAKKLHLVGADDELIACQGSAIYRASTGEVLRRYALPSEIAMQAVRFLESKGEVCHAYADKAFYSARKNPLSEMYAVYCDFRPTYVDRPLSAFLPEMPFTNKVIGIIDADRILDRMKELRALLGDGAEVTKSSDIFLEVTSAEAGKGTCLLALAESLGISREETVAVGDNLNDLSMIVAAGLGASVGNGVSWLKERADLILPSIEEDGVAVLLERILDDDPTLTGKSF